MGITALAATPGRAMLWAPRLLAAAVSLFLATFSIDTFSSGKAFGDVLPEFVVHLIPSAIVIVVAALAWHREWIGAVTFVALAVGYAVSARTHPSWIAVISGPLLVIATLYAWNWMHRSTGGQNAVRR